MHMRFPATVDFAETEHYVCTADTLAPGCLKHASRESRSEMDSGLSGPVTSVVADETRVYAGTQDGVWVRPLSEVFSSVRASSGQLPAAFELCLNFPNPFNPSTRIRCALPSSSGVRLSVHDILDREVSVLVNERKNAGSYEMRFDGGRLSTGVYFHRLQAGDFSQTKRLLLLK
jgi:hypothetical protein